MGRVDKKAVSNNSVLRFVTSPIDCNYQSKTVVHGRQRLCQTCISERRACQADERGGWKWKTLAGRDRVNAKSVLLESIPCNTCK
jgi:hypothetical protein